MLQHNSPMYNDRKAENTRKNAKTIKEVENSEHLTPAHYEGDMVSPEASLNSSSLYNATRCSRSEYLLASLPKYTRVAFHRGVAVGEKHLASADERHCVHPFCASAFQRPINIKFWVKPPKTSKANLWHCTEKRYTSKKAFVRGNSSPCKSSHCNTHKPHT